MTMTYETVASRRIHRGRVFSLRQDQVRLPDASVTTLDIIEHGGAAVIVPLDADDRIWFVRQYRHAIRQTLLELPAGTLDQAELPEECAAREVREEIGMSAARLTLLGTFYLAPGYSSERLHVFLGSQLSPARAAHDPDEFIEVVSMPSEEAYRLAASGEIQDGKTLAALLLLQAHRPAQLD